MAFHLSESINIHSSLALLCIIHGNQHAEKKKTDENLSSTTKNTTVYFRIFPSIFHQLNFFHSAKKEKISPS